MSTPLQAAFLEQAVHCDALGSPFMGRLMRLCGERLVNDGPVAGALFAFGGNLGPSGHSVPLRFAGALHHLSLAGLAPQVTRHWPPNDATDDAIWNTVCDAMAAHGAALLALIARPPQTNEIRRSAALIPALHVVAQCTGLPIILSELGASAGLNLLCDQFHLTAGATQFGPATAPVRLAPEWRGQTAHRAKLIVQARQGVDIAPFDIAIEDEHRRLLSYLWPDQPERLTFTRAALEMARKSPPKVASADAIAWLEKRLSLPHPGAAHVVYHTVAWQYFPQDLQARGEALLANAGARATPQAPLARFSMENDGDLPGARLRLQIWPDGTTHELGRADFHGRWVDWTAP